MKLERLKNLQKDEDGQYRGVMKKGMIPITWDLWTYSNLEYIIDTEDDLTNLSIKYFAIEGFRETSKKEKPHYKEFLDVLINRRPIFEAYRILAEEEVVGE